MGARWTLLTLDNAVDLDRNPAPAGKTGNINLTAAPRRAVKSNDAGQASDDKKPPRFALAFSFKHRRLAEESARMTCCRKWNLERAIFPRKTSFSKKNDFLRKKLSLSLSLELTDHKTVRPETDRFSMELRLFISR